MSKIAQPDTLAGHFALILAALTAGRSHLVGLAQTEQTQGLAACLRALGAEIDCTGHTWQVTGRGIGGLISPAIPLQVSDDATAACLLAGALAPHDVFAVLAGSGHVPPRVLTLAETCGARIEAASPGALPAAMRGARNALPVTCEMPDALGLATALLAGLGARGLSRITGPDVPELVGLLQMLGADVTAEGTTLVLHGQPELHRATISLPHQTRLIIAVDGPAAAGKGTLARRLASHFALPYLDTGLLYRATGRRVLDAGHDPADHGHAAQAATTLTPEDLARGDLRGPEADRAASAVASIPAVRAALLDFQRNFGARHGAVLDGRDIGTHVFPNAPVKLFVTASPEARGQRRHAELLARGAQADLAEVTAEIIARDHADRTRAAAPMQAADDAVTLDTTEMNAEEALAAALAAITGTATSGG